MGWDGVDMVIVGPEIGMSMSRQGLISPEIELVGSPTIEIRRESLI